MLAPSPEQLKAAAPTTKVYSYTRWSTPEQANGDSLRRQTQAAERWAEREGLVLDTSLAIIDDGRSAYRGRNAEDGGLGRFLEACRGGLIERGSILLVESLDRISRMEPLEALLLFKSITDAGVTIVTLSDGQSYTKERLATDHVSLLVAMMVAMRAHEESRTKSRRVAEAWSAKRQRLRSGEDARLTLRSPSWLLPTPDGWTVDEPKATIVRRIYAMTLAGDGENKIAQTFNTEKLPVLGRGKQWHRSTVSKVLRNPTVIGTMIPGFIEHVDGRKVRRFEEPVAGVYPPIIAEADWLAVQSLKDGSTLCARGRHAGKPIAHILAGLAKCPACGTAMTRINKGSRAKAGTPRLVCSAAKSKAGCRYVSVPVPAVEDAFFRDWGALYADVPAGDAKAELDKRRSDVDASIDGLEAMLGDLDDALSHNRSRTVTARISRIEAELRLLREDREKIDGERAAADHGIISARLGEFHELLNPEEGEIDRAAVNAALKVLFPSVVVDYRSGCLRFVWRQGGDTEIRYAWVESKSST